LWREIGQCVLLSGLTVALFAWISPPYALPLLAFVCLAPWLLSVLTIRRAWLVHWSSFVFGWLLFLINLRWLMPVTGLGYAALAFYLAIYWPLTAWAVRTGRRHGIAPLWSFPIIWVACEYLRAWLMSGFPWLFLAHSLYSQSWLIQISDLVGAYGVSFLLALVNAVVVGLILMRRPAAAGEQRESPRQVWPAWRRPPDCSWPRSPTAATAAASRPSHPAAHRRCPARLPAREQAALRRARPRIFGKYVQTGGRSRRRAP
jgi:apolipoprotein N-acyltransferase